MNKNKLKAYAPQAREAFIKVVSERSALYGITEKKIEPCEIKGDYAFIYGKPFPKAIESPRKDLIKKIESKSFHQVMEEIAYTWFNRFAAIRFMEINGYLAHGYRVLSHPEGHSEPEILEKAHYLEGLDGLAKNEIIALKTSGIKDAELYRKLIIAQCNELHSAMPFLFEKVDDPTELLLPDNLLNTDSITRQLVAAIPEDDWKEVEIIGWLYQFYIFEKKDALMKAKKAYKTEDIPAVTQLFTPNWIVKYLVQNSLGSKWLATYPASKIKEKMEYYIEPAEQSDDVKKQLKEITPEALNPEELTVMDPACGSGHILVEAYELLKEIYLERGYRPKDIPALIITKNLFGLEIDERAAQLSGFALMMKARADDNNIFAKEHIQPNIVCIQETADLDREGLLRNINTPLTNKSVSASSGELEFMDEIATPLFAKSDKKTDMLTEEEKLTVHDLNELLEIFEHAKTFGSLIRIPQTLIEKMPRIRERLKIALASGDLMARQSTDLLVPYLKQSALMSRQYDCVIANPPYMGSRSMESILKGFATHRYPDTKSDLFAMFIERGIEMARETVGMNAMVVMQGWMFLSSFEGLRSNILSNTIQTLIHIGYNTFPEMNSKIAQGAAFVVSKFLVDGVGVYVNLNDVSASANKKEVFEKKIASKNYIYIKTSEFKKIPGCPVVYWLSNAMRDAFVKKRPLKSIGDTRQGMATSDNDKFLRLWFEVSYERISLGCRQIDMVDDVVWVPYNKGGETRKWWGNQEWVINWENNGHDVIAHAKMLYGSHTRTIKSMSEYFKPCISWSKISWLSAFRYFPSGFIFDVAGCSIFLKDETSLFCLLAFLNSKIADQLLNGISPTLNYEAGHVAILPFELPANAIMEKAVTYAKELTAIHKDDWNGLETSWEYSRPTILSVSSDKSLIEGAFNDYLKLSKVTIARTLKLQSENNKLWYECYGIKEEERIGETNKNITLSLNPMYRYGKENEEQGLWDVMQCDTIKQIVSYAIGCMMGRYSLDKPGLIYAQSGNEGFDPSQYKTFPADNDGIIPITDQEWFDDDTACRFFEFIETAWDKKGLDTNLNFIAVAIGRKASESSRAAIRRYFVDSFYKDHCQTYKKRPIYWLFTSGKEKAFQALVYLHRYNEGTLSRMRTEYVLPLQTKISRHIEHLEKDKENASSTSAGNKIQKEIAVLLKQKEELIKYDEQLRHYADMKIKLDLDDGVKVNYGKFGDLLANVQAITGSKEADE